jgi:hypothetical protein
VSSWPPWNREIAHVSAEQPLALGGKAKIRFNNRARMTFIAVEFEQQRLFTDQARLSLARMGHRHLLTPLPSGGIQLLNTIYPRGPLSWLSVRILGAKAAAALPDGQSAIERIACEASEGWAASRPLPYAHGGVNGLLHIRRAHARGCNRARQAG